ncbi:MAG: hypothetical protein WD894_20520, partial [Pirellulales bacterium]
TEASLAAAMIKGLSSWHSSLLHFYGVAALTPDTIVSDRALRYRAGSSSALWLIEMEDVVFELPNGWKRNLSATFKDDFVPARELYVTECTPE